MPRFDRTGPSGAGARTGEGRGPCGQGIGTRRFSWRGFFRGIGRGGLPWGGGRGWCFGGGKWSFPFVRSSPASPTEEAKALKAEIASAKEELTAMEARLGELEKKE